jgi:hypothetical protein
MVASFSYFTRISSSIISVSRIEPAQRLASRWCSVRKGILLSTAVPDLRESVLVEDLGHRPGRSGRKFLRTYWVSVSLTLIVVAGAAVRLVGIAWGLPLRLHPDEWVIVDGAIDMARRHSFEPPYYFRPDHVETQLSNLAYLAYSYIFHGSSPQALFANNQTPFFLISRSITACFGVGMIVLSYRIGRRFNQAIGVMSALFVAFFPPFVANSHMATPDIPLTFAFMIVILGCMRYLEAPRWGNVLLACLGVSIAIAIKYPGVLGTLMIAIVVIVRGLQDKDWRRILIHGAGAIGAVIGFLFLISPVLFTNGAVVWENVTAESGGGHAGADNLGWTGKIGFYATDFTTAAGITMVLLFLLGAFWSVRLRLQHSIPLWLGIIVWPLISLPGLHWARWGLPMYLSPLLIAPIGIYYSAKYLRGRSAATWVRGAVVAIVGLMVGNLVLASVAVSANFLAPNTQSVGQADFAARGATAANTISEGYSPFRPGGPTEVFGKFTVLDGRLMIARATPHRSNLRYVAVSSDMDYRYYGSPKYKIQQRFYQLLSAQYPLVATLDPVPGPDGSLLAIAGIWRSAAYIAGVARGGSSGPTIRLYEIPADRR